MLTEQQGELLRFIKGYQLSHRGVVPSYDEMAQGLQLKSKSGIHRLVRALEERGHIRRLPGKARAIEIIKKTEAA